MTGDDTISSRLPRFKLKPSHNEDCFLIVAIGRSFGIPGQTFVEEEPKGALLNNFTVENKQVSFYKVSVHLKLSLGKIFLPTIEDICTKMRYFWLKYLFRKMLALAETVSQALW